MTEKATPGDLGSTEGLCLRLRSAGVWVRHDTYAGPEPQGYVRDSAPFEAADLLDLQAREIAALRTAVAAERERWESALGAVMPEDFKDWHQNSSAERPTVAAWAIRNLRDREAFLESMLADVGIRRGLTFEVRREPTA